MNLPIAWVERIFDRLTTRYGTAFRAMYADIDPDAVKGDWSYVLGGLGEMPHAIAYGLENLPEDKPPTPAQFRAICNRAPAPAAPRLVEPRAPMPEAVRQAIDAIAPDDWISQKKALSPAEYTIRRIEAIAKERGRMTTAQKRMIEACRQVAAVTVDPKSPEGMADRQRTDALKETASEAVAAYASSRGIDLAGASDRPRKGSYRPGANPMRGAWGPGFGPQEQL